MCATNFFRVLSHLLIWYSYRNNWSSDISGVKTPRQVESLISLLLGSKLGVRVYTESKPVFPWDPSHTLSTQGFFNPNSCTVFSSTSITSTTSSLTHCVCMVSKDAVTFGFNACHIDIASRHARVIDQYSPSSPGFCF